MDKEKAIVSYLERYDEKRRQGALRREKERKSKQAKAIKPPLQSKQSNLSLSLPK